ncbi:MAG: restriction endonuclease [Burkholderiales bacterium]|nr:restriction endonuclease [Burkholderiales bacterium]
MFQGKISDYFEGVAAKYLSAVDAEPERSNGHEIGGLPSVGFKIHLGTPNKDEEFRFRAKQVYISDESEAPVIADSHVTWYDARRKQPHRSPEFRLYYYDSPVTACISEGDFFLVAKLREGVLPPPDADLLTDLLGADYGSLLMVFTPAGSSIEHQLRAMFGLDSVGVAFSPGKLDTVSMLLPLRMMLEDLGVEVEAKPAPGTDWLGCLIQAFGGKDFPTTSVFSHFARDSIAGEVSPLEAPDATLMSWMEHEESLFRIYERHIVQARLKAGFGDDGQDVDAFINFSLSVQNRRKSRVGHAFEGHLDCLFKHHGLKFEQGRGKGKITENNSKPDFIFPSFAAYHDQHFQPASLMMLGAKTTCKDRWRQVLSEANRIPSKHLVTLEAAISGAQLEEMRSHHLQLVVPFSIHSTYSAEQKGYLMDVQGFIHAVREIQK